MKLSERIQVAEQELVTMKDALVQSTEALEAAPDEESLLIEVEELTAKVEKAEASVAALKKAEAALAVKAQAAPAITEGLMARNGYKLQPGGDLLFKHATATLLAHIQRKHPLEIIEQRYADTPAVKATYEYLAKSATKPAMTGTTGWAAELVQTDVQGFLASVEDISIAAGLAALATTVDFGGFNSVTVPMEDAVATNPTEPAWVAEGAPIPLTAFSYSSMTLNRYKLAAITTFTREIAERSTPQIEGLLREGLRKAYARVLDQALLNSQAAIANVRPAGLYYGVTAGTPTAGGGDAAVRADILALLSAMTANRLGTRPVLIMNNLDRLAASMMVSSLSEYIFKDELAGGTLMSIPVLSSAAVPQHELALVDAAAVATAFDVPMFDVSDVATVVEASADASAPTMASNSAGDASDPDHGIVPSGGGIPVYDQTAATGTAHTGYTARSLWQTYSLGIRMIAPTSWGVLRAGAVEYMTGTTWTD